MDTTAEKSICIHECLRYCNKEALFWINNQNDDEQNQIYMNILNSIQYKYFKHGIKISIIYYKPDNFIRTIENTCPNIKLIQLNDELKISLRLHSFCLFDNCHWIRDSGGLSLMGINYNPDYEHTINLLKIFNFVINN